MLTYADVCSSEPGSTHPSLRLAFPTSLSRHHLHSTSTPPPLYPHREGGGCHALGGGGDHPSRFSTDVGISGKHTGDVFFQRSLRLYGTYADV